MLKEFVFFERLDKDNYKQEMEEYKTKLLTLQQTIKENDIPVIIIFEGPSASGKGSSISQTILSLDPRFFKIYSITPPNEIERKMPWLHRFMTKIPKAGQITFFDRSWYQEVANKYLEHREINRNNLKNTIQSIKNFERLLTDSGYLIIKFYLHITKKEQKERLLKLVSKHSTQWRVTKKDWKRNKDFDKYMQEADKMLCQTDFPFSQWHIIDGVNKRNRNLQIFKTIINSINHRLKTGIPQSPICLENNHFNLIKNQKLNDINLNKVMQKEEYKINLTKYQEKIYNLQTKFYLKKTPVIIVFEGWDAAGKGGAIKRVSASLDARGYSVNPISAPTKEELSYHYLWRFYNYLPKDGHFAIFDRSWYGRVMVERVEQLTDKPNWQRAYTEINEFESELTKGGALIVKFFLHIDKETQLKRFKERENTPSKKWKITSEDYRNREKWNQYEVAIDDMIKLTSTNFAPWNIIESNDKYYSRIKVLKLLYERLSQ